VVTIGILSPGAMGAALGRAWQGAGAQVVTTVAGRSKRTRGLAQGLTWLTSVDAVVAAADIVVSIVPPAQALANAEQVAAAAGRARVQPLVADLNAVSPGTMARVADILSEGGCRVLDGAVSGGPPAPGGTQTRLYLSGTDAATLAGLDGPGLHSIVVGDQPGQASAVKMCTAAVYKGTTALLLQALRTADAYGAVDAVVADWEAMLGMAPAEAARRIAVAAAKSDRFPSEMREIAATQGAAGRGSALYEAVAEVFEDVRRSALGEATPEEARGVDDVAAVVAMLRETAG
jgi:3-hydroxyisobutyrate dehydrogenase-like beta-hydroxyacid dehydrogenase